MGPERALPRMVAVACAAWSTLSGAAQVCPLEVRPLVPVSVGLNAGATASAIFDEDGAGPNPARLFLAGPFTGGVGGFLAPGLVRWDGQSLTPVGGTPPGTKAALRVFDDGGGAALFVGGATGVLHRYRGGAWSQVAMPVFKSQQGKAISMTVFDPDGGGPLALGLYVHVQYGADPSCPPTENSLVFRYDGQSWAQQGSAVGAGQIIAYDHDGSGPAPFVLHQFSTIQSIDPGTGGIWQESVVRRLVNGAWEVLGTSSGPGWGLEAAVVHNPDGAGPLPPVLVIGGSFVNLGGVFLQNAAAWDGQGWLARYSAAERVRSLESYDADGAGPQNPRLLAGGSNLLSHDGAVWSVFDAGTQGEITLLRGFDPDAAGPAGPTLIASGGMTFAGNQRVQNFAEWRGTTPTVFGASPSGPVRALAVFDDGSWPQLYAGGHFARIGTQEVDHIARWTGSTWQPLGAGIQATMASPDPRVNALLVHDDGSGPAVYAAGRFAQAGAVGVGNIARWRNGAWEAVGGGVGGGEIYALATHDVDGPGPAPAELIAGGDFGSAGGQSAPSVAIWSGSAWRHAAGITGGQVRALLSFDDGSGRALYAGGELLTFNAIPSNTVAKLGIQGWAPVPSAGGTGSYVNALGTLDGGLGPELHAAGRFYRTGQAIWAQRLRAGAWETVPVYSFSNTVIADIPTWNAQVHMIGRTLRFLPWNGVVGLNIDGSILAVSPMFDDGNGPAVFIGGDFVTPATRVARLTLCPPAFCYANCDHSTAAPVLNITDFTCFLQRYAAGDPRANCDRSLPPMPTLTVADFTCFLQQFAAGCP